VRCLHCGATPPSRDGIACFAPELADSAEGFDPGAFARLAEVEPRSFWFRSRNALIVELVPRWFPTARSALEIGCGTGYVLQALHERCGLRVTGTELHPEGLRYARERLPDAELLQVDARHIPFREEFDLVGAFDVLEHIPEDEAVLREVRRATRPGGGLLLTVPQHPGLWSQADDYAHHSRRYRRRELVEKVTRAGFRPLAVTSFVSVLLPAMALSRVRARRAASYDPWAEFDLPRRLDRALERLLAVERRVILRGASLPVGGSLALAARAV